MIKKILLFTASAMACMAAAASPHSVYSLRCEQMDSPMGIGSTHPRLSWMSASQSRGFIQQAYRILVATDSALLKPGRADVWDSQTVRSDASVLVPYGGEALKPATAYYWCVMTEGPDGHQAWSLPARFDTGLLSAADWGKAQWIALEPDSERVVPFVHGIKVPEHLHKGRDIGLYTLPQMRRQFKTSDKEIASAKAYICGLGHFELFVNGDKVSNHFLDPGWTMYDREALYLTFDVTDALRRGDDNVLSVMLGNGFYNIPNRRYYKLTGSYGAPKMIMRLDVRYADGSEQTIVSDRSWRAAASPITYSSIYGGEDFDARLYQDGWMLPGFDDRDWKKPVVASVGDMKLKPQEGTHLEVRHVLPVVKTYINDKGHRLYDLGQNSSGIVRMRVKGRRGQTLRLRLGELLNPDGTPNQSASGDPFYLQYTIGADSVEEVWQPQFTYYGFRYAQLEDAVAPADSNPDGLPVLLELQGLHTTNAAPATGTFACSKPLLNDTYRLIDWAIRSNMASVLTDCPHREKIGWQEQNYLMQNSMLYNYDLSVLFHKIMSDMESSQTPEGVIPTIAPEYVRFADGFEDTPEWGSAFIICPWTIYQWYGDDSLLARYYPAMQRYLDYLGTRADGHIVAYGLGDWFDIAPGKPGRSKLTSNGVTATATYYLDARILADIAQYLGKSADAARYRSLAADIKKAYNDKFFNSEKGYYDRNSQTANAISLHLGLVPDGRRDDVLRALVADIQGRGNALTAGDIGYRYVLRALEEGGRTDVIFDMNSKYDVPGYGWQLAHGATALTESWQAYGFVSNNHLMLGHLMEWLYSGLGGIRQAEGSTAWKHMEIDPQMAGDVTSATTTHRSPYGDIACSWSRTPGAYTLDVTIPANSTATVALPAATADGVTDFGSPVTSDKAIRTSVGPDGRLRLDIGSGTYRFNVPSSH